MDPSQTSFFQLLSSGTKMYGPSASEIVLDLATVALGDGASVFIVIFQEVGTFHLAFGSDAFKLSPTRQPSNFHGCCPGLGRTDRVPLLS